METLTWLGILSFAHVLGAALWVGGTLALAPMTAGIRRAVPGDAGRDVVRAVARRAQPALWVGFLLAAGSGWLLLQERSLPIEGLVVWKIALALVSASGAALHTLAARRRWHPAIIGGGAAVGLLAGIALLGLGAALRWS